MHRTVSRYIPLIVPRPTRNRALANEFQVARFLIVRLLGLCYTIAFLVLLRQGPGLIGEEGILPLTRFVDAVSINLGGTGSAFAKMPSLFWFFHGDAALLAVGWIGFALGLAVLCGYANSLMLFVLWSLQISLVHTGQLFWGYGWETQLLETTFLAVFLVPLLDGRPFPRSRPSRIVIALFIWLIVRIMLGAGLIKLRGDAVWDWGELSALFYHFETQPIPNGLSWYLHHLPRVVLQAGVLFNHVVELFLPALLLLPRSWRNAAGVVMVLFQVSLIVSGNLSFLNYLTIIPCLACIDDRFYGFLLPRRWWVRLRGKRRVPVRDRRDWFVLGMRIVLLGVVAWLSIAPVRNLVSPAQRMNTSFDRLHLVNTYGAFGSVGKVRYEIVIEGTDNLLPESPLARWKEYQLYGKPGEIGRRPPTFAPYQRRLDWEIWFAAMGQTKGEPWPLYLAVRLLENEPAVLSLFRVNPFPDKPPIAIRMTRYVYRFTTPEERKETGNWWVREPERHLLGPVRLNDAALQQALRQRRWPGR